jgi:itaconyl-CoA hydratase
MALTGPGTFYDDYAVGDAFRHARGRTVTAMDVSGLALLTMNTSDGHFNDEAMRATAAGRSVAFGCVTLAIVVGLAMQDTGENATAELGLEDVRFRVAVVEGDTLTAATRVLEKVDGVVTFEHHGFNQRGETVVTLRRRVRIASARA